jgi:putative ABC transport system permease protein
LRETTPQVAFGIVIGVAAGLGVTRLMRAMLYEVGPADPLTFIAVPLALCLVGLVAALIPARRAAAVSPVTAMRD